VVRWKKPSAATSGRRGPERDGKTESLAGAVRKIEAGGGGQINLTRKARAGRRDRQLHTEPSGEWAHEPRDPQEKFHRQQKPVPAPREIRKGFGVENRAELSDTSKERESKRTEISFTGKQESGAAANEEKQTKQNRDLAEKVAIMFLLIFQSPMEILLFIF
jgi:hypothetical protein